MHVVVDLFCLARFNFSNLSGWIQWCLSPWRVCAHYISVTVCPDGCTTGHTGVCYTFIGVPIETNIKSSANKLTHYPMFAKRLVYPWKTCFHYTCFMIVVTLHCHLYMYRKIHTYTTELNGICLIIRLF